MCIRERYNTASLLELESGSNDPFAYMLTAILLSLKTGGVTGSSIAYTVFAQLVYGGALGVAIGMLAAYVLRRINFGKSGMDNVFVFAIAIFAYALPGAIGGNGFLSVYIAGVIMGNANIRNKRTLVPFFDGVTNIMQMCIFFLLGLLSFPSRLPQVFIPSIAIALFLTFRCV